MAKKQAKLPLIARMVFFSFILAFFFVETPARAVDIEAGRVVTAEGLPLYYVGFDKRLHPFPSTATYHSWFSNFTDILYVGRGTLSEYQIGSSVCIRPGTWLVRFRGFSEVYAVEPGCRLRKLRSDVEAYVLFGSAWERRVVSLDAVERAFYRVWNFDDPRSAIDTDKDGVSDYEEAFYWLTDPDSADSDSDGRIDGEEILSGSSPSGDSRIGSLAPGMYTFPAGSLFAGNTADKFFYQSTSGDIFSLNRRTYEGDGTYLGFNRLFLVRPAFDVSFSGRSRGVITSKEARLYYPTVDTDGMITTL